jgi:uncharacterized protein YjaG (DUF416 family)
MNYEEFNNIFRKQVFTLTSEEQLEFALTICKELFFDYQKFSAIYNWGDPDILMNAIKICDDASKNSVNTVQVQEMMARIDSITPDMDDFGDEIGSYALNASAAVYETLEFLLDNDNTHICNIGSYYTDTIHFRVQEHMEMSMDQIDKHPMMITARNFLLSETR